MNEFLILLEIVKSTGYVYLLGVFALAVGLFIFDGRTKEQSEVLEETPSEERMAA